MKINNAIKKYGGNNWCRHTDNAYGGRNHKSVRKGKRILRRKLKQILVKLTKED